MSVKAEGQLDLFLPEFADVFSALRLVGRVMLSRAFSELKLDPLQS